MSNTASHELIVPDHLDFDVSFDKTRVKDKKYVINSNTDEAIAIIGRSATARNHAEFYNRVWDTIVEDLSQEDLRAHVHAGRQRLRRRLVAPSPRVKPSNLPDNLDVGVHYELYYPRAVLSASTRRRVTSPRTTVFPSRAEKRRAPSPRRAP